ncbi:putative ribonuclease H-like domain-containing protein [Tanacetum coccineum]
MLALLPSSEGKGKGEKRKQNGNKQRIERQKQEKKRSKAKTKQKKKQRFCGMKGIKREFSVARTPQQNRVAERKNKTLIEAARTMLADSLLPTTFWAEAVNTTRTI